MISRSQELPYVSRFEYSERHKGWFWKVSLGNLLCIEGFGKKKKAAHKEARKVLLDAYIEYCEDLAREQGKTFDPLS